MVNYDVPFYSNTPGDTHCFQASVKMVAKYFWPEREYGWEELDRITAKAPGLWTWPLAGLLWLQKEGIEVVNIEPFDYERFIERGGDYLMEMFGQEMGKAQIARSDIVQEQRLAGDFTRDIRTEKGIPSQDRLRQLLGEGYIAVCNVNSRKLNDKEGYAGHFVVIKGFDEQRFFLHDPGLPPQQDRIAAFGQFESAWAYPDEKAKNIMAFRRLPKI